LLRSKRGNTSRREREPILKNSRMRRKKLLRKKKLRKTTNKYIRISSLLNKFKFNG
jgi:hypothetical protein